MWIGPLLASPPFLNALMALSLHNTKAGGLQHPGIYLFRSTFDLISPFISTSGIIMSLQPSRDEGGLGVRESFLRFGPGWHWGVASIPYL